MNGKTSATGRLTRAADSRGFTVLELMVVLVILGMILGIAYQAVIPKVEEAKVKTAKAQMEILGLALDNYRLDVGQYPASLGELIESSGQGWKGPYLKKKEMPLDPWKNPYVYEVLGDGSEYRLSSTGGGKTTLNAGE